MRIIDAARRPGISIAGERSIREAAQLMESSGVGALVVLEGERPAGIVTDRDLVRRALAPAVDLDGRVDAVMSMPLRTIDADADLHDAVRTFHDHGIRRLAVTQEDRFVAMITVDDLIIDLAGDLTSLARPLTAEMLFAQRDAPVPVPVAADTPDAP